MYQRYLLFCSLNNDKLVVYAILMLALKMTNFTSVNDNSVNCQFTVNVNVKKNT